RTRSSRRSQRSRARPAALVGRRAIGAHVPRCASAVGAAMSNVQRFATQEPTVCAVCRRRAMWVGYAPLTKGLTPRHPPMWLCGATECSHAARTVHDMRSDILDAFEIGAALEAGAEAGRYLEECGTTDLAKLDPQQWREFLRRLLTGFEQVLRRKILT